jgi:Tfp pilus assembly protein PilX
MRRKRRHEEGYVLLITVLLLVGLTFMGLVAIQLSGLEMQMAINEDINQECKACADGYQRYLLAQPSQGPAVPSDEFPR